MSVPVASLPLAHSATSTHETISSSIEPPLSLSGANYSAHRFRLRQQSDASSHSSDSTVEAPALGPLASALDRSAFAPKAAFSASLQQRNAPVVESGRSNNYGRD